MTPTTDQLKDLLTRVTPGRWKAKPQYTARIGRVGATVQMDSSGYECACHDATLIALAPTLADEVVRLREAVENALVCLQFEINPSNYNHDDACRLNDNSCEAYAILAASICMGDGHSNN